MGGMLGGGAPKAPSAGELANKSKKTIETLAPAVGGANIAGMQQGTAELTKYLEGDGRAYTLDPRVYQELNDKITATDKKLKKPKATLESKQESLRKAEADPKTSPKKLAKLRSEVATLKATVEGFNSEITKAQEGLKNTGGASLTDVYKKADPQAYAALDSAGAYANKLGQVTPQGQAFIDANSAGYQSKDIAAERIAGSQAGNVADVQAQQMQAAQAGGYERVASRDVSGAQITDTPQIGAINAARVRNISAQQVGQGQLGQSLYQTAQDRLALNGRLSSEASRDAVQQARAGYAARGMATGNSALAGELLNRDRYSQQRFQQDGAFASAVQNSDIVRQQQNSALSLDAARSNQAKATQLSLANQAAGMDAARANQAATLGVNQANAGYLQQANLANQDAALRASGLNQAAGMQTEQYNAGLRQSASVQNQDAALRAALSNQQTALSLGATNAQLAQQAALANQQTGLQASTINESNRLASAQQNINQLGAASNYMEAKNAAGMNAQLGIMGQYSAMNPLIRNLGLGNMYNVNGLGSQVAGASIDMVGGIAGAQLASDSAYKSAQMGMIGQVAGALIGAGGKVATAGMGG